MKSPSSSAPQTPSRHAILFVLITVFLDMVGFGIVIPVLPRLIEEVGEMSLAEASIVGGWMFFAYSIGQFIFGPFMGNLSDRFGRRPLLLLAILGLGLDNILQALAPNLEWLFVGRVISGICGASWIIANAYIADITAPEERARYFGLIGAAFGLGFVLGPAIGGLLGEFGPRVPFYVAAAISGINLIYGWFVLPETLEPAKRRPFEWARANPFGAFKVFQSRPGIMPLCLVLFFFFFCASVYQAIWSFWGIAKFGWSPAMVGLSLAIFGIITAAMQGGLTGPLVKRFGEYRMLLIGLIFSAIGALGYGVAGTLPIVILMMIIHAPEGFVMPLLQAMMTRLVPENAQGELQGGISVIMNIAALGGTVFFSQIFGYFLSDAAPFQSPSIAFLVAAGGLVATLGLFVALIKPPVTKVQPAG